ncbi:MAG: FAD-dependent oxidoreductase [Candidatus Eisenbacteria bacterium]|nr:FAD-dependent oxidoreductase [Candidatus Eisenbacteria bacterium]
MDSSARISGHPVIDVVERRDVPFTFNGRRLLAKEGEVISSAVFAHGIHVFGHHYRDGSPQGIFCVNGQCSQCLVLADGVPVKACMTLVREGMDVRSCEGIPALPCEDDPSTFREIPVHKTRVLVIGGGPAGVCAAIELGKLGVQVLLVDDKPELGGKLTLQTHSFFGSKSDCWAGTRGIRIAEHLRGEVSGLKSVEVWVQAAAVAVFSDRKVGVLRAGKYELVEPDVVLVACGAREKTLPFPGCDLPGVYGAGAFQTLANRDLVRPSERLFVVGGGNVGLIGSYHALQAGIRVVGLCEALPECSGYKVHKDKIMRLGVPVYTSHTVVRVEGREHVERVTIAECDKKFKPLAGTEKSFAVDTVLIAVGLSPIDELYKQARQFGMEVYAAGDSEEIAEASAAIFSGKMVGRKIARSLGLECDIPPEWDELAALLRSKPGRTFEHALSSPLPSKFPVVRCVQEIPCDPCTKVCPKKSIVIRAGSITGVPEFRGECLGCARCVAACPGLAITLVELDYDPEEKLALLTLPYELSDGLVTTGQEVETADFLGNPVGRGKVVAFKDTSVQVKCRLMLLEVPYSDATKVAGIRTQAPEEPAGVEEKGAGEAAPEADPIICRCERVRKSQIVEQLRAGVRDMNHLKATLRTGMGACGGKTCRELILGICREEGIELSEVTQFSARPFEAELPLSALSGCDSD